MHRYTNLLEEPPNHAMVRNTLDVDVESSLVQAKLLTASVDSGTTLFEEELKVSRPWWGAGGHAESERDLLTAARAGCLQGAGEDLDQWREVSTAPLAADINGPGRGAETGIRRSRS